MKTALITGICGQDGSYLAELLLEKGYSVYGMVRRSSSINTGRIDHIYPRLILRYGDLSDTTSIQSILNEMKGVDPEVIEIYNLGAMSHVKVSFDVPEYTGNIDALGVLRILDSVLSLGIKDIVRFYQASSSELYGKVQQVPQTEETPFYPRSPYGVAKLFGFWITKNYRESYGMFACNGILFNHESPRRGETFVTRKITMGLNKIIKGELECLTLGNLDAKRDWGHAADYVHGMWRMLQQSVPDDYVLSTNEFHTVREFVEKAFRVRGYAINWRGNGLDEVGYCTKSGRVLIKVHERYFRPTEVDFLLGDSTKAKRELGWSPTTGFDQLVKEMVDADCC
jgi:GDPmannose 4,6-dehydratase